jgi:ABC-type nitrate/sulfonate/bicarbonate transport system permease component
MIRKTFTPFESSGIKILATVQAAILLAAWITFPSKTIPNPVEIARAWHLLASEQGLLVELLNSAITIWKSLFYSSLIAFTIAFLSPTEFFKSIFSWLTALRFLGFAGITFLFTLWTGDGAQLKIWLLTFGMTTFLLTNMIGSVSSITQDEVDYARTLRLNGWGINYELFMRGRLDEVFDLIRQNAAMGWTLLSMVEGLVRYEGGIGALLLNQNRHFHLSAVFAIQITILVYGIIQDRGLKYLRLLVCPHIRLASVK